MAASRSAIAASAPSLEMRGMVPATARAWSISAGPGGSAAASRSATAASAVPRCQSESVGHGEGLVDQHGGPGRIDDGQPLGDRGQRPARRSPSGMVSATARAWSISAGSGGSAAASCSAIAASACMALAIGDGVGHGEGLVDQRGGPGRVDGGQQLGDRGQRLAALRVVGDGVGRGADLVDQRSGPGRVDGGQPPGDRGRRPGTALVAGDASGRRQEPGRSALASGGRPAARRSRPAPCCAPGRRGWCRPRRGPGRSARRSGPGRWRPAARRSRPAPRRAPRRRAMVSAAASAWSISAAARAGSMAASRSAIAASAPARRSVSGMVPAAARAWSISAGSGAAGGGQLFGDRGQAQLRSQPLGMVSAAARTWSISVAARAGSTAASRPAMAASAWPRSRSSGMVPATARAWSITAAARAGSTAASRSAIAASARPRSRSSEMSRPRRGPGRAAPGPEGRRRPAARRSRPAPRHAVQCRGWCRPR